LNAWEGQCGIYAGKLMSLAVALAEYLTEESHGVVEAPPAGTEGRHQHDQGLVVSPGAVVVG
jgi:hypothetical protein